MKNYSHAFNLITKILTIFFITLVISSNVLAQDNKCPEKEHVRNLRVDSVSHALKDDVYIMKKYTGYDTPNEAQLHCDNTIKEKTAIVNELHTDDYDDAIDKIKYEIDRQNVLLKHQTASCNECIDLKLDEYEKKFIKKNGDHRYGTKGYRTKIVVVWGEAERIPTDAQAKYDLLYDEYISEYDPSNDRQFCLDHTQACKDAGETASKIKSLDYKISLLKKRHKDEISANYSLQDTIMLCNNVYESIEKYNEKVKIITFLKECKYNEDKEYGSINTDNYKNVNITSLKQANKAINNARSKVRSAGRIFGLWYKNSNNECDIELTNEYVNYSVNILTK